MSRPDSPDPDGSDESFMSKSETLDEDDMAVDPLEEGMDPPERWSGADRYGTTHAEERADRALDSRLAEERPDVPVADTSVRPLAATPLDELDETVDTGVIAAELPSMADGVLAADEVAPSGEAAIRTEGRTVVEPDQPAADETVRIRDEDAL